MKTRITTPNRLTLLFALLIGFGLARADELITLDSVGEPGQIKPDEKIAEVFSAKNAARSLDTASLAWQHSRDCAACHTNMVYLFARPALDSFLPNSGEVRRFFEEYPSVRWEKKPPTRYRPVVIAAGLTFHDVQTTGKLSGVARQVLDMMWTTQREDGSWNWPKCGWAPMEVDDHFGVTLAALTAGIAPGGYAETERAKAGLADIRKYLRKHPAKSLHHRMMISWASLYVDDLMTSEERAGILREFLGLQLPGGGWSTPGLFSDWAEYERKDGKPHDPKTSDAYATGFAIVLAREMGLAADHSRLQAGIKWLKSNQRVSGRWFTRSPAKDGRHLISNTATAYAVLALQSCGELPGWPFSKQPPSF